MSGSNFPNGPIGPGFSLNFFRPELRATAQSSDSPAHSQSRSIPSNRNPFLSAAHGGNPAVSMPNPNQKHSTTAAAAIPNLTVIAPKAGMMAPNAAAEVDANTAHWSQFSHNSVLTSLFQSLLRGQNPIAGVNLAMQSVNVAANYVNSTAVSSNSTSSATVCPSSMSNERYSMTSSKPSTTQSGDSSERLVNNFQSNPNLSNLAASLHGQQLSTPMSASMKPAPPAMNHDSRRTPTSNSTLVGSTTTNATPVTISNITTTCSSSSGINNNTNTTTIPKGINSAMHPLEVLFHPTNITTVQPGVGLNKSAIPPVQKLSAISFLRWAAGCTRSFRRSRLSLWPRSHADIDALHGMNWIVAPTGLLGIYSESPFLRPVLLLRRVQFATPGNLVSNFPDPDNMIRTLRDLADSKVTKYPAFAPDFPSCASAVGFTTDYLSCVFTLDLDRLIVKLLSDQLRPSNRRPQGPEWRVVLRLGWATTDFYLPPLQPDKRRQYRALVLEALPRCLSVRVGGRPINLPDPIFHGGQAQRLGKRLRLSIDITDRLPIRPSGTIRNRIVDIEVNWLHAPLEDQSQSLLDLVAGGQITPLLCHLIGLPLIQITLDRLYSIRELQTALKPDPTEGCVLDRCKMECMNNKELFPLLVNADGSPSDGQKGVWGAYDNCTPAAQVITTDSIKHALKVKFEASMDEDLCITDGTSDGLNYIPICLLCPLTRTRIELPVRSVQCAHLQCFDFNAYLTINRRRPRWSCPICSAPAPFRDLRLDELFTSILDDPSTANATFVHVDPSGQWRLAPEEGSDSGSMSAQPQTNAHKTQSAHNTPTKCEDVTPLSPPRLVAACGSRENSPALSGTAAVIGEVPPDISTLLSPVKSAAADPAPTPSAISDAADIEVIVLSDDDDEEDATGSEAFNSPSFDPTNAVRKGIVTGPLRNGRATSETSQSRGSDATASANPDEVQIDLTVDDDDDDDHSSVSLADLARHAKSPSRSHSHAAELNSTSTRSQLELDERLHNARPLILVSPLPLSPSMGTTIVTAEIPGLSATNTEADSDFRSPDISKQSQLNNGPTEHEQITSANTIAASSTKSTAYRHLFDTFGNLTAQAPTTSSSGAVGHGHDRPSSDESGVRSKRRHLSDRPVQAASRSVRPVSSYLDSAAERDMDDCVPGVDLFDYSDDEPAFSLDGSRHLPASSSSSYLSSSSMTLTSNTGRNRPPLLKAAQANALNRLVQQRACRPHSTETADTTATTVASSAVPTTSTIHSRARKSTSRGGLSASRGRSTSQRGSSTINPSAGAKRARRTANRRRSAVSNARVTDDSDSSNSCFSSEMSCVSASDEVSPEETCSEESSEEVEEDDSVDSLSSDDRWSPSRSSHVKLVVDVRRGRVRRSSRR